MQKRLTGAIRQRSIAPQSAGVTCYANGAIVAAQAGMTSVTALADAELGAEGRVIAQKYRLESLIGEGGMGAVWRAFNLQLEVPVALKLLRAGVNTADLGERLRIEARAVAKLVHPSIVRVFDIGEEVGSGEPFIVMELLEGESLGTMLERGPVPAEAALQLLLPIGEALVLAHSHGVVHRDIKPDNIFIASAGVTVQPKLLDFGIAKVRHACTAGAATLTQTGTLLGSPEYMSPEQACGRFDIDERSDVWAFCVVLYEVISGRAPFEGDNCQAILRRVVSETPLPLELFTDVDPELSALIHLGADPRSRRSTSINAGIGPCTGRLASRAWGHGRRNRLFPRDQVVRSLAGSRLLDRSVQPRAPARRARHVHFGRSPVAAAEPRFPSRADVTAPTTSVGAERDRTQLRARGQHRLGVGAAAQSYERPRDGDAVEPSGRSRTHRAPALGEGAACSRQHRTNGCRPRSGRVAASKAVASHACRKVQCGAKCAVLGAAPGASGA